MYQVFVHLRLLLLQFFPLPSTQLPDTKEPLSINLSTWAEVICASQLFYNASWLMQECFNGGICLSTFWVEERPCRRSMVRSACHGILQVYIRSDASWAACRKDCWLNCWGGRVKSFQGFSFLFSARNTSWEPVIYLEVGDTPAQPSVR